MRRVEVWWVRFGPSVGGKIQKERPAVIVSKKRLMNREGTLSAADMRSVAQAILTQLGLPRGG